jgi:hypothetical protein
MGKRWFAFSVLVSVAVASAWAEPALQRELKWSGVPPTEIRVGDRLEFKLEGITPNPEWKLPYEAVVLGEKKNLFDLGFLIDTVEVRDGMALIHAIAVQAGKVDVPDWILADSEKREVARVRPFQFEAKGLVDPKDPDKNKPDDFYGPLKLAFPTGFLVAMGILGLLIAALIIWGIFRFARSIQARRALNKVPEIQLTEDEWALRELGAIERKEYAKSKAFKKHYFGVSDTLKEYFGRRYGFAAPEKTSAELAQELRERNMPESLLLKTIQLFERLDLTKFTDHEPASSECPEVLQAAREIVQGTKKPKTILSEQVR